MSEGWLGKFIGYLAGIIKEPPYLIFLFVGSIFVIVSILSKNYFNQTWTFFIYSVIGTIWRYIERDMIGNRFVGEMKNSLQYVRTAVVIYHIGNIALLLALLQRLDFI